MLTKGEIVDNIGATLKLPEEDILRIKLSAGGEGLAGETTWRLILPWRMTGKVCHDAISSL